MAEGTTAAKKTAKKAPADRKRPAKKATPPPTAKAAPVGSPSDVSAFKKKAQGHIMPLPSGLVVKAKRVELTSFLQAGSVPNPLMGIVSEALEKGSSANVASMVGVEDGNVDLDMVRDMYEMVNRVVVGSVIEPTINPVPDKPSDRDDDLLYVDEVDDTDKMFIFQWACGGTDDLATFREEARADLASLAEGQGAVVPTE